MRDQGRLVEWFDDKGYGFIQPNDSSKDRVFLHIKDFAHQGPRPIVGCALEYTVLFDGDGRFRAQQVIYLKASQTQKIVKKSEPFKPHPQKLKPMQIVCVAYILLLVVLSLAGLLNGMLLLFISIINAVTYWFYVQDKQAAELGTRRVSEKTLHLLSLLGGWPSAWLAQEKLRHKTQKQPFRRLYFCTIALNLVLILWLIFPLNVFKF